MLNNNKFKIFRDKTFDNKIRNVKIGWQLSSNICIYKKIYELKFFFPYKSAKKLSRHIIMASYTNYKKNCKIR